VFGAIFKVFGVLGFIICSRLEILSRNKGVEMKEWLLVGGFGGVGGVGRIGG
jgi:hypothetical protein